jgi:hypothetical protein
MTEEFGIMSPEFRCPRKSAKEEAEAVSGMEIEGWHWGE